MLKKLIIFMLVLLVPMFLFAGAKPKEKEAEAPAVEKAAEQPEEEAKEFPWKPIEFIIPFGAGGSHDLHARAIASVSHQYFPKPIVPVLKPGGSGAVGSVYVRNSPPDGHTLLFGHNGINVIAPHVRKVDYSMDDFIPVCQINYGTVIMAARKDSGITSIEELVQKCKENPNSLTFVSSGIWGALYIPWILFVESAGIQMQHLPTAGGGPALQALLAGDGEIGAGFPSAILPHIKSGDLIPIAVTSGKRLPELPDVPTFKELGYDFTWQMWRGVLAPKGTPMETIKYLSDHFAELVKDKSFIKLVNKMGERVDFLDYQQFKEYIAQEEQMYRKLLGKYYKY